jgi:hypothetical protein
MDALYWSIADAEADIDLSESMSLIQSGPSQESIDAKVRIFSDSGVPHRICIDGRTINVNRTTYPYIATPTLTADKSSAVYGEDVTVTVSPSSGKQLISGSLKVNGVELIKNEGSSNEYSFKMPDTHVNITAEYENLDPDAGKLLDVWFALDEDGNTKVPLMPVFNPEITSGYELTFYDSQLTETTSEFFIKADLSEGSSSVLRYTMEYLGSTYTMDGPEIITGSAIGVDTTTIFYLGNGLEHYIRVTSSSGDMLDYAIKMSLLPTLKNLNVKYGSDADAVWDKPFSSTTFDYLLDVPDDTTEITLTPELQTSGNIISMNSQSLVNNEAISIPLNSDGVTEVNLKIATEDAENLFTNYSFTIMQPKAAIFKWQRVDTIINSIASTYMDNPGEWQIMDLAAYKKLNPDTDYITSGIARQNFINRAVSEIDDSNTTALALSKYIITLKSIGIDASKLFTPSGSIMRNVDAPAKLRLFNINSIFDVPWVLIANQQGNLNLSPQQIKDIVKVIKDSQGDGLFGYTWDGIKYDDPDTAAVVLSALSPYYLDNDDLLGIKEDVDLIVNKIISALQEKQLLNGSFGNANTDASVIIGLTALGIDPDVDFVKNGNSLLDGLLSYALTDNSGFGWISNTSLNDMATEQGLRALIAVTAFKNQNAAYNIYDFSDNLSDSARATGPSDVKPPADPISDTKITVYFRLMGMNSSGKAQTWISKKSLSIPDDSTAAYAIIKALENTGYAQSGAGTGYIKSITTPDGYKLSEKQSGWPNSGWLFKVNSDSPEIGISEYILLDNDFIELYFTKDFTKEPGSEKWSGISVIQTKLNTIKPNVSIIDGKADASVSQEDISNALDSAKNSGDNKVTISLYTDKKINSINLNLASSAIKDLAKSTGISLNISSPLGDVTIPSNAIKSIASQSGSSDVKITLSVKAPSDIKIEGEDLTNAIIVELNIKAGNRSITEFDDESLNITIPLSSKYKEGEKYKIYILSADGSVEAKVGNVTMKNGKPYVNISTNHLSTFVITDIKLAGYNDVYNDDWYYNAVEYVSLHGFMKGTGINKFDPYTNMTRAMLVMVLYNLEGSPNIDVENTFIDVEDNQWYTNAVLWSNKNNIAQGYGSDLFGINDSVTRQQVAAIMYRYSLYKGYDVSKTTDLSSYKDKEDIAPWALKAMEWANSEGIIIGTDLSSLSPNSGATRAQTATIIMNFYENIIK